MFIWGTGRVGEEGPTGPTGPGSESVANIAAMQAIVVTSFPDGVHCWVRSVKRAFILDTNAGAASAAEDTYTSTVAGRLWMGSALTNSRYWMGQLTWFIDGQNSTGLANDENSGLDAAHPLLTDTERQRRMGPKPTWDGNRTTAAEYHVRYISDTTSADYVRYDGVRSSNAAVFLHGSLTNGQGQAILYSGSITALDVLNRARGVNRSWQITDSAIPVSWTASDLVEEARVRLTSGAAIGAKAWIVKDLGAKKARVSQFAVPNTYSQPFALDTSTAAPSVGDTYVIERLTKIPNFAWALTETDNFFFNTSGFGFNVDSLDLGEDDGVLDAHDAIALDGCTWRSLEVFGCGYWYFNACYFANALEEMAFGSTDYLILTGGYADLELSTGAVGHGGYCVIDKDFMSQGFPVILDGFVQLHDTAVFDSTTHSNCGFEIGTGRVQFYGHIWGSGNLSAGIQLRGGQMAEYSSAAIFTIEGNSADILFGSRTIAPAFDPTVGRHTPPRTMTFANLAAAIAAGGFGGNIVDPVSGCQFVLIA